MPVLTKEQILGYTSGSTKGADIYKAQQQHGFSVDDVDSAFGLEKGKSQSWINQNVPAPAPVVSLDKPPAATTPIKPVVTPAPVTPVSAAVGKDPMIAIRQVIEGGAIGEGGKVATEDAMNIYNQAMSGKLTADDVALASGIPVANIQKWLSDHKLSLISQLGKNTVGLDVPPGVSAVTGSVTPQQTAAQQLMDLLRSDSPYIQMAENAGIRQAQARGGINSSMAAGSARKAAIEAAAPLAINDANTYSRQAIANQDSLNTAANLKTQLAQSNLESIRSNETSRLNQLASNETQINIQKMSDTSRDRVESVRLQADIDINDRTARGNAFNNMVSAVGVIEGNPELNTQQKTEAINRTVGYYEQFLAYQDVLIGKAA